MSMFFRKHANVKEVAGRFLQGIRDGDKKSQQEEEDDTSSNNPLPVSPDDSQQQQFIRENWITTQLSKRAGEFTESKGVSIFCGTWNVNGKKPTEDLAPWLLDQENYPDGADVYAIGFQEIVDLNATNLVVEHNQSQAWEERITSTLPGGDYIKVTSKHLVGVSLGVYVRKKLFSVLNDELCCTVGVGIMGVGGNKGAVAIRIRLYDSTLVFINSHLAAHKGNTTGRNADFMNISRRIQFVDRTDPEKPVTYGLSDHDHCFWLGDLNYRLNLENLDEVYAKIEEKDWQFLLPHDQLTVEKASGRTFQHWKEADIKFPPTYKYIAGTSDFDRRENKSQRMPAWTDRVQWRGEGIDLVTYDAVQALQSSDHKPVLATFKVQLVAEIPEAKKQVRHELARQLDTWENQNIPKVEIRQTVLTFDQVRFEETYSQTLEVVNIGEVMVQFSFAPKAPGEPFAKPWLQVEPEFGLIPPGEAVMLTFIVNVMGQQGHLLNSGQDTMDDILILKLKNGRDYFLTIAGSYRPSVMGASVAWLVKQHSPLRGENKVTATGDEPDLDIPKELWRLVDYIFKNHMQTPGIFVTPGVQGEVEEMVECLDTEAPFPENVSPHSVAETLVRFLDKLSEPLFALGAEVKKFSSANATEWCKHAVQKLPQCHYNTFIYIVSFLRELLREKQANGLASVQLAVVFSEAIFHESPYMPETREKSPHCRMLQHFMSQDFVAPPPL